jgi:peptidoglycan/xylan/chitin deacetylase (PgdA/CDA1 family)
MRKKLVNVATKLSNDLGFFDIYGTIRRKITKSQVAILLYHRVGPAGANWSLQPLSPDIFKEQIDYFSRSGEIISLEVLANYMKEGKSLPKKTVVITFDDGYYDNYMYAYPILKRFKVPATIFLTTGHISSDELFWWDKVGYILQHAKTQRIDLGDMGSHSLESAKDKAKAHGNITKKLKNISEDIKNLAIEKISEVSGVDIPRGLGRELIMSWNDVKEMHNSGIDFGAHSVNHPLLTNVPLERAKWEITQSKKDVENSLGVEVRTFSYPNGDCNAELKGLCEKAGFVCAASVSPSHLIRASDSVYSLSRISMTEYPNLYKLVSSGFQEDYTRVFRRDSLPND